jgi:hypothetical protein
MLLQALLLTSTVTPAAGRCHVIALHHTVSKHHACRTSHQSTTRKRTTAARRMVLDQAGVKDMPRACFVSS